MDRQRFAEKMKTASDHVDAGRVEEVMQAAMRRLTDENEMLPGQVLASMYLMEETGEVLAAMCCRRWRMSCLTLSLWLTRWGYRCGRLSGP